ncbi:LysR family transcriptional regulator [Marinobacterium arenosum]|uniref:LysR family transcriptional regulator n=1 Tax=Marinobacterium arenosum TaxID=2862496 RepID=UPI001C9566D8|nr:LysR family transcriptional regulator [Marinobacterium arenosum]MBY4676982.1 LysR family transcriptional regulator [Marinobacterium arenosum]
MDFASLQIFKAVVDEGGVQAAARKLHRVQSNITTRIKQLEASLGVPLFDRQGRRLVLTPAGELLLGYAEQILQLGDEARQAVADDRPCGTLRIGTLESLAAGRLPPLLSAYHQRHPDVSVALTTGTTDALVAQVRDRTLEAAFVADCQAMAGLPKLRAWREQLVLVLPRSQAEQPLAQLPVDTVVGFSEGCEYRRRLLSLLQLHDRQPRRVLELGSYHAMLACVASGSGLALVPRSVLQTVNLADAVAIRSLDEPLAEVDTWLIWRSAHCSGALRALQQQLAEFAEGG